MTSQKKIIVENIIDSVTDNINSSNTLRQKKHISKLTYSALGDIIQNGELVKPVK
jgi:hypothetical protein